MNRAFSQTRSLTAVRVVVLLAVCIVGAGHRANGQGERSRSSASEQRVARFFESIRKSPPQMLAFLVQMPKGGDLHNHLSGAVYAESYIQWAADSKLCINTLTMTLSPPAANAACDPDSGRPPATLLLKNTALYGRAVDAWSMRNWQLSGESGHDHFFNAFARFGPATWGQTGKMLAETVARAARGHVIYLELMLTPDGTTTGIASNDIANQIPWDDKSENFQTYYQKLKSGGIDGAAAVGIKNIKNAEAEKDRLLGCGTAQADPGCTVTIRYIAQVLRGATSGQVFAQMVTGFALANDPNSKVVGLNLVQPEDSLSALQNFSLQMQMLQFLRPLYPQAHVSLHAGELALGAVPPADLTFHIRESVMTAGAERIGHGVDLMHETQPYDLLKEMARRHVMVEICLSSNDLILGVAGKQHPLATYMQYGVPTALATDDEGVSRSEISREFLKGVEDQGLGYSQLKTMARNSLQYAFISGTSLWSDANRFNPVTQCRTDALLMRLSSSGCRAFIERSEKAKIQWKLEEQFREFERAY